MTAIARQSFGFALAASLALHVAVLASPGSYRELFAVAAPPSHIDVTLALPAKGMPLQSATPSPKRKARPQPSPVPIAAPSPALAPELSFNPSSPAEQAALPPQAEVATPVQPVEAVPHAVPPAPTSIAAFATTWPRRGRIVFQVTRGEDGFIVGQSEHIWSHDGEAYTLRSETETVGLAALFRPATVVQESHGIFVASGLQPLGFEARREGKPKDSVRFDTAARMIHLGNGTSAPFAGAAQDLLSLFYQLGALPAGTPLPALTVATGRKIAEYSVRLKGTAMLVLPQGERRTLHYVVTSTGSEDTTEVWLDGESRLPLKIRHRDRKGEVFDQIATIVEQDKSP